jgi:lipid-A-disaccharide synthase
MRVETAGAPTGSVVLVAGEPSGDAVAAELVRALRRRRPELTFWGIGGPKMAEAGVELLFNCKEWASIGVVDALRLVPRLAWQVMPALVGEIRRRRPAVVVPIDFGAFNMGLARRLAGWGPPVAYYFPPGSWRKSGTVPPEIGRLCKAIITPFPWSEGRLRAAGANAHFVGHPLVDLARPSQSRAQFSREHGIEADHPVVGLLPGSRGFEIRYNLPAMLAAAWLICDEMPQVRFVIGLAPTADPSRAEAMIRLANAEHGGPKAPRPPAERSGPKAVRAPRAALAAAAGGSLPNDVITDARSLGEPRFRVAVPSPDALPVVITQGKTYDVIASSDVLLACSGTATLEAAIMGTPMAVLYKLSPIMEVEGRLRGLHKRLKHIAMPNVAADRTIVQEYLQGAATPEAMAQEMLRLLRSGEARSQMRAELAQVRDMMGAPGASDRAAGIVLECAEPA